MGRKTSKLKNIFWILFLGLVLRLLLSPFGTLSLDQGSFIAWSKRLYELGPKNFYSAWSDYLPGFLYVLWPLGKAAGLGVVKTVLYKLPAIIADLIVGYLVFKIVRDKSSEKKALLASSFFVFNPAVIANSTFWGQVDIFTGLFSLLTIYFFNRGVWASIFLGIGILFKPQVAFAGIPLLILLFQKKSPILLAKHGVAFLSTFFLLFIPFFPGGNFFSFVGDRLFKTLAQYPYSSINAFNFWGLFGFWQKDSVLQFAIGLLAVLLPLLYVYKKRKWKVDSYETLSLVLLLGFIFGTRLHERHLLPALVPLSILILSNKTALFAYIGLSLTYVSNLLYSYFWVSRDYLEIFPALIVKVIILINIFLAIIFIGSLAGKKYKFVEKLLDLKRITKRGGESLRGKMFSKKIRISKSKRNLALLGIVSFSLFSRVYGLGTPQKEYFDEVYHAFTARIALNGDPKAWEWWNEHPEGFAYEWTHPPVAKLGMMLGMSIFGENAFGWRIAQALLGAASIYLVYAIAKEIFKDELLAIFAALILSLEGLFLVMSRIGMNDIFFVFFALFSLYYVVKRKIFLSALFWGLSVSSKWSAIWFVPIIFVATFLFREKKEKGFKKYLWFLVLPPLVYLASYIPMFLTGHDLGTFVGMQKQMWWYHTRLDATHSYTSSWWTWPFLMRPVYLYTSDEISGVVSRIYALGNPFIFWGGAVSIILSAYYSYKYKIKTLGFIVFSYFVVFASWAISPRIMFLYHYLPAIPFLAISLAFVFRKALDFKKGKFFVTFSFLFLVVSYIYFYPHWSGLEIPLSWDTSYYWFPIWR